jgi:hypothetical protein
LACVAGLDEALLREFAEGDRNFEVGGGHAERLERRLEVHGLGLGSLGFGLGGGHDRRRILGWMWLQIAPGTVA